MYVSDISRNARSPVPTGLHILDDPDYPSVPKAATHPDAVYNTLPVDDDGEVVPPAVPIDPRFQLPLEKTANGILADARRHAEINASSMSDLIAEGYDAIASCTSCSMALCQEHPELFDIRSVEGMAANTFETVEYLRVHENLRGELAAAEIKSDLAEEFAYNAPCHARNQGLDRQAVELFRDLNGVDVEDIGESCSDISGTYG